MIIFSIAAKTYRRFANTLRGKSSHNRKNRKENLNKRWVLTCSWLKYDCYKSVCFPRLACQLNTNLF